MKKQMITWNAVIVLLLFTAAGCEKNKDENPQKNLSDCIKGKWYVTSIGGQGSKELGFNTMYSDIEFTPKNDAEGNLSGTFVYADGETEIFSGTYSVDADGAGISTVFGNGDDDKPNFKLTCNGDQLTLENTEEPNPVTAQRDVYEHPRYQTAKRLKGQWNVVSYKDNGIETIGLLYNSLSMHFDGLANGISTWAYTTGSTPGSIALNYEMNDAGNALILEYNGQITTLDFTCTETELKMSGLDIDGSLLDIRATR